MSINIQQKSLCPNVIVVNSSYEILSSFGYLWRLNEQKLISQVTSWVGVGNSAYLVALLAAGIDCVKIYEDMLELDFSLFMCLSKSWNVDTYIQQVTNQLNLRLNQKFGFVPTLKELYLRTHKRLVLLAFNINTNKLEYIYDTTHPNISVVQAVICSMGVYTICPQVKLDSENLIYTSGAIVKPYPIDTFIRDPTALIMGIRSSSHPSFALYGEKIDGDRLIHRLQQEWLINQTISHCDGMNNVKHVNILGHQKINNDMPKLALITLGWQFGTQINKVSFPNLHPENQE